MVGPGRAHFFYVALLILTTDLGRSLRGRTAVLPVANLKPGIDHHILRTSSNCAQEKRGRAIPTVITWDVWAAAAIAAVGIILAVVFDQSPLLVFILVGLALCAYIAIRNRFDDEDETPVETLD